MNSVKKVLVASLGFFMLISVLVGCDGNRDRYEITQDFVFGPKDESGGYAVSYHQKDRVEIPAEYKGCPITSINNNAFYKCGQIQTVIIPDSVRKLKKIITISAVKYFANELLNIFHSTNFV